MLYEFRLFCVGNDLFVDLISNSHSVFTITLCRGLIGGINFVKSYSVQDIWLVGAEELYTIN